MKNIKALTWFNFFTDLKLYAPFAVIYFSKVAGSFTLGMSIFSIVMISSAFFEVPTGIFSDLIGRKKTVVLGAISAVVYTLFYAIANSFYFLVLGALFEGLSRAFYSGNNDAFLYDTLKQENKEQNYHEVLGKTSSMFQLALTFSAIFGGIIGNWSFSLILWISVFSQIICFFISLFLSEPKIHSQKSGNIYLHLKEALKNFQTNYKLRLLSVTSMLKYAIGEATFEFQSAFYNTLWPVWAIGFAKAISGLSAAISFRLSGKAIRRFNIFKILIFSNLYNRIVCIIATIFPSIFSPVLMSSTSMLYGVTTVADSTLLQKEFKSRQRATMGSLNSLGGNLLFGFFALLLGMVADKLSPAQALLIFQLFSFITLGIYWKLFKDQRLFRSVSGGI